MGTKQWDTLKKSGTPPSSRSGYCMALHKRRIIIFGGVHDEDTTDGEGLISTFYNDLHAYNLDSGRWHELSVSAPRKGAGGKASSKKAAGKGDDADEAVSAADGDVDGDLLLGGGGRRRNRNRRGDSDEEDEPSARAGAGKAASSADAASSTGTAKPATDGEAAAEPSSSDGAASGSATVGPIARMNAAAALRGNALILYGGLVEPEEASELTLSDMWSIDLAKLDGWSCIHEGEAPEKALVIEDDSDSDGEEGDGEEDEDSDSSEDESDDSGEDEGMPRAAVPVS